MPNTRPTTTSASRPPDGAVVDNIFRALSDPTRRQVLERLARSPASTGELSKPFEMALPSLLQHLRMLEGCGLVRSEKHGRVRTYHLETKGMQTAEDWLSRQRTFWEQRLNQLDAYLLTLKGQTE